MRLLIVDDERPARARLRHMLALEAGIDGVDEAADGFEALDRIHQQRPDAVLLDIDMPELSGMDLAARLGRSAPLIVFVTAHPDYALRAFDVDAVDYLAKPFDQARLHRALERIRARLAATPAAPVPRQLLVPERGSTRIVPVDTIEWLETADNYVALHTAQGAPLLRHTLAGLLDELGPAFARCHRRAAVRLAAIERVIPLDKGDCELLLHSGARVPCSRQHRAALLEKLYPLRPA